MRNMANTRAARAMAATVAMWAVIGLAGGIGLAQEPATPQPAGTQPATAPAPAPATATTSPAVMLEKGIYTEETVGDLDAAIKIYQQIVEDAKAARKYAAQAQYRLGMCYLKKGDKAKAQQELRELQATYPQEKDIAARAEAQLRKLSPSSYPEPAYEALRFGPVIERTLSPGDRQHDRFLDLDTGKMFDIPGPEEVKPIPAGGNLAEMKDWTARRGIDLMAEDIPLGFELAIFPQPNARWDALPPPDLLKVMLQSEGATPAVLAPGKELPSTFYFKTREERLGVLQIIGYDEKKKPGEPRGIKIRYKLLEYAAAPAAGDAPRVIKTTPEALANDVEASLDKVNVTFDRPMMDKSWSFTGGGETFPQKTGEIFYDKARMTCTMPVKLRPGKVYWVGVNSPSFQNFKSADGTPAARYVILFATRSAGGKATPLPEDLARQAMKINAPASQPTTRPTDADRKEAENLSAEGWALWNQRKLPEAEAKFQAAVAKDPTNANAWNGLGSLLFSQGKPANAKEAFEKAMAVEPKHTAALTGLGWIARGQSQTMQAIEYLLKAVEAEPSNTAALGGLAGAYAELGEYDKAIAAYEQWVRIEPEDDDAKESLEKTRQTDKALLAGAENWLGLLDRGEYVKAWEQAGPMLRTIVDDKDMFAKVTKVVRDELGAVKSRKLESRQLMMTIPGLPGGPFQVLVYDTQFEKKRMNENVIMQKDRLNTWGVVGYTVAPYSKTMPGVIVLTTANEKDVPKEATAAAEQWLGLVDAGKYAESWDTAAEMFQRYVTKQEWQRMVENARSPLGKLKARKFVDAANVSTQPDGPVDKNALIFQFQAAYEKRDNAVETVSLMKGKDGKWRVSGYFIR